MLEIEKTHIRLDPWSASSLLQKAIRRGEVELAHQALTELHRFRGKAVWRRLANIAVEDVGIADVELVWEVIRLATDPKLRDVLGPDAELLDTVVAKLAMAPKDRSSDYVYCAATKLPAAIEEREQLRPASRDVQLSIAATLLEPLMKRLSAALLACTVASRGEVMIASAVEELLAVLPHNCPTSLAQTVLTLAELRSHPYSLVLILIWSQFQWMGGEEGIAAEPVPRAEYVAGIPLYTFDKHTAVGKRAISMLPKRCSELGELLAKWVPTERHADVALMAAFYADAAPVSKRLEWFAGKHLEFIGMHADMMSVGCPYEGVVPITECVRRNLETVNELRRGALLSTEKPART